MYGSLVHSHFYCRHATFPLMERSVAWRHWKRLSRRLNEWRIRYFSFLRLSTKIHWNSNDSTWHVFETIKQNGPFCRCCRCCHCFIVFVSFLLFSFVVVSFVLLIFFFSVNQKKKERKSIAPLLYCELLPFSRFSRQTVMRIQSSLLL